VTPPLGLYLHVPFCAAICNYCNFNRGLLDEGLKRRYVGALADEIRGARFAFPGPGEIQDRTREQARPADTIYFGGGTPSLLDPPEVASIVTACREAFELDPAAEITLEANPESVDGARLAGYRAAGVNRVSFGVQSFRDPELRRLGRLHDAARARAAVAEARRAGFDNVSLDLMLWLPGQTLADLDESLEALVEAGPEHASLYLLEIYPNAPLKDDMARAGWSQAPDDDAADMYLRAMEVLERVGFGCGAHSTVAHVRWNNVPGTSDYVGRVERRESPVGGRRVLSPRERVEEALFMELRLTEGVRLERIRETYGIDVWAEWGERLARYVDAGLLDRDDGRLRLTREGMLLANDVMSTFLEAGSTLE
jgi:oxygen-independent coproporphyrinogen-3 oxidase